MELVRYPDRRIEVLDERFAKYKLANAALEMLWTGGRWLEGPVWFGDGRYLLFSDIPNNRILKWEEETGRGLGLPQAIEQHQRQHARSRGAIAVVRTRRAPSHADGIRRFDHGVDGPVRG